MIKETDEDLNAMDDALKFLKEMSKFDAVLILATKEDEPIDGDPAWATFSKSYGNVYSCMGLAEDWLARNKGITE